MEETNQEEKPAKKRGWPKGKPRGPRMPVYTDPPAVAPQPEIKAQEMPRLRSEESDEPVRVEAFYKTGQTVAFYASAFELSGPEYRFTSYPDKRGYKVLHIIQKSEVVAISIMAPEMFFSQVRPAAEAQAPAPAIAAYPDGDPRVSVAPRGPAGANRASGMMHNGVPMSEATVFEKGQLQKRVIGAAMV